MLFAKGSPVSRRPKGSLNHGTTVLGGNGGCGAVNVACAAK